MHVSWHHTQVMVDPVILKETGQTYERKAIELWYNK